MSSKILNDQSKSIPSQKFDFQLRSHEEIFIGSQHCFRLILRSFAALP